MKSRIEELEQQLLEERQIAQNRINEVRVVIERDQEILNSYVERFTHAIQDEESDKMIEQLSAEREKAEKRVEQNRQILKILSNTGTGSKIQRILVDLTTERFDAISELNTAAEKIFKDLKANHDALLTGLNKLASLNLKEIEHLRKIDSYPLDRQNSEVFGIQGNRGIDPKRSISNDENYRKVLQLIKELKIDPSAVIIQHEQAGRK